MVQPSTSGYIQTIGSETCLREANIVKSAINIFLELFNNVPFTEVSLGETGAEWDMGHTGTLAFSHFQINDDLR